MVCLQLPTSRTVGEPQTLLDWLVWVTCQSCTLRTFTSRFRTIMARAQHHSWRIPRKGEHTLQVRSKFGFLQKKQHLAKAWNECLCCFLQLNGGGLVPLSHAVCCRPCLPKTLPGDTSNSTALAILSLGCHASSNPGSASLRCEAKGGSLVSGKTPVELPPNTPCLRH